MWYKNAIIYQVHVRSFADGDGVGDFAGLISRLDHIERLGITAIWLLPFYPSPLRDDGYDIADYCAIHQDYGTLADFRRFLREAHRRGLKVVTELVLNHTSDQHAWFQKARSSPPGSAARDFYVWSHTSDRYPQARIIFQDFEPSNWTWDPLARAHFWHRFYSHQPDLNFDNPRVQRELLRVVDFWLDMGVDGLRLDAVPYLYEREGTNCENLPETHQFLKKLRAHVDAKYQDRMLLAEANQWPEDAVAYFGNGDECHMAFHFPIMPRIFMSLWMEDRNPVLDILEQTPAIPDSCQWLRTHQRVRQGISSLLQDSTLCTSIGHCHGEARPDCFDDGFADIRAWVAVHAKVGVVGVDIAGHRHGLVNLAWSRSTQLSRTLMARAAPRGRGSSGRWGRRPSRRSSPPPRSQHIWTGRQTWAG